MNTNELNWLQGMHQKDTLVPVRNLQGETVYTIYLADFFKMPDVNFHAAAAVDVYLKSLFN